MWATHSRRAGGGGGRQGICLPARRRFREVAFRPNVVDHYVNGSGTVIAAAGLRAAVGGRRRRAAAASNASCEIPKTGSVRADKRVLGRRPQSRGRRTRPGNVLFVSKVCISAAAGNPLGNQK